MLVAADSSVGFGTCRLSDMSYLLYPLGARVLPDGSIAVLCDLLTTRSVILGCTHYGYGRRFCFEDRELAVRRFHELQSEDDVSRGEAGKKKGPEGPQVSRTKRERFDDLRLALGQAFRVGRRHGCDADGLGSRDDRRERRLNCVVRAKRYTAADGRADDEVAGSHEG